MAKQEKMTELRNRASEREELHHRNTGGTKKVDHSEIEDVGVEEWAFPQKCRVICWSFSWYSFDKACI